MTKPNLKVKREDARLTVEMEYTKWKITSTNSFLNILGVYRPPDGSIPQFLDIFTELLVDIVASNTNLVILGDFNIHVNDANDPNASLFLDTMTALINHNSIWCILNIPKEDCTCTEVIHRKLSEIDLAQLVNDMSLEIIKAENLDDKVTMLEENFSTALNNQAPEVTKVFTVRKNKPWFGNELELQKRKVCRREKAFKKCILQSCLTAFDKEQKKYKKMLSDAKITCYSAQVRDCKGETKELYKLVNTLMGTTSSNPHPNHTNDKLLANEFADFFMNKIQKIRDNLTENPVYQPTGKKHTKPYQFQDHLFKQKLEK